MYLQKVAALALLPLVLALPSPRQSTAGTIVSPADGAVIAPGAAFDFQYQTMADYGVSSYNYTVWLLTSVPTSFAQSNNFAEGHYLGRFAEPNYPGNPNPSNLPPAQLVMPDFSKNPGGFGLGESESNGNFVLAVLEEYATGFGAVGSRFNLAMNRITYNSTSD
ncbi:hypothetical protein FB45DRAFT_737212 [Roridomyces roridus]|uniref:Uncharacterized protein n=1 Tax=Roridomyces roridus TaxID=1738132 RepID=A0AAD7CBB9_9AGAR|nr:hypothetical protein FB45DRAFT_737212 [Roridomyces roridus]